MNCPHCNAPLDRGQGFCSQCGNQIVWDESRTYIMQPTQGANAQQPVTQAVPQSPPPPKQSAVVPILVALCSALVVVLIGVGLMAAGIIRIGGQEQTSSVTTNQASSGSAKPNAEASSNTGAEESSGSSSTAASSSSSSKSSSQTSSTSSSSTSSLGSQPQQKSASEINESTPEPATPQQSSEYVLPNSATHLYSADELAGLSDWELYIARNEIYARHGRGFVRQDLNDYFGSCSWYTRLYEPEYFDANISLSDVETANAETILDIEHYRGSPYV